MLCSDFDLDTADALQGGGGGGGGGQGGEATSEERVLLAVPWQHALQLVGKCL